MTHLTTNGKSQSFAKSNSVQHPEGMTIVFLNVTGFNSESLTPGAKTVVAPPPPFLLLRSTSYACLDGVPAREGKLNTNRSSKGGH